MAGLTIRGKGIKFEKDDNWNTPKSAWELIKDYIPTGKVIWEAFYGDGNSGEYLRQMGFDVIHEKEDFFETEKKGDIIISNPPFSCKVKIFQRLRKLDLPFILILPISTISKQFYMEYFADKCKIIIPNKRIHFEKNGEQSTRSWFDVVFICYKIDTFNKQILYLK
jgi:hypothetical protein